MQMHLHCQRNTCVEPSDHVLQVAAMFGLGVDETRQITIVPPIDLTLQPHQLLFITGASGGGKSTLLRLLHEQADAYRLPAVHFDALHEADDQPLVDLFAPLSLEQTLRLLSLTGLNDAFVMLRKPSELSDGQRYRLQLARAMATFEQYLQQTNHTAAASALLGLMLADEFAATLDRPTAAIIARKLRQWVNRMPICCALATTHDDLLEPLEPDVLIVKGPGDELDVIHREKASDRGEGAAV